MQQDGARGLKRKGFTGGRGEGVGAAWGLRSYHGGMERTGSALRLEGLLAAAVSPTTAAGALALGPLEALADRLAAGGLSGVYVAGTNGEGFSLTGAERRALAERWLALARPRGLAVIVQVGHLSLDEARGLAEHAESIGADAIAALAPTYVKPRDLAELVAWARALAAAAPGTPFLYYDFPRMSGIELPAWELLEIGRETIPTLAGVKYTNSDLSGLQRCLAVPGMRVLAGNDPALLAHLALGVHGAIGGTYALAPGLYARLRAAFAAGDLERARAAALRSARLVQTLAEHRLPAALRHAFARTGLDLGPPRSPTAPLSASERAALDAALDALEFPRADDLQVPSAGSA